MILRKIHIPIKYRVFKINIIKNQCTLSRDISLSGMLGYESSNEGDFPLSGSQMREIIIFKHVY